MIGAKGYPYMQAQTENQNTQFVPGSGLLGRPLVSVGLALMVLVGFPASDARSHEFGNVEIVGSNSCCYIWNYHWHGHPIDYSYPPAHYSLWSSRVSTNSTFTKWVDYGSHSGPVASDDTWPLTNNKFYQMKLTNFQGAFG
jgi:hypothetical protein